MMIDRTRKGFAGSLSPRKSRRGFLSWIIETEAAYRENQKLSTMTDAQLRDIGVSREEAVRASKTSLWDAPIQFR